ncbi:MAG: LpxL/LpxP family acyltransferase [Thiobacillus sp.]
MSTPDLAARVEWAQRGERSNMAMLRVMTWISLRLGRRVARVVLRGISLYFLVFAHAARRASRTYLARALGRPPTLRDVFRHFHSFAACIHDRVYLLNDRFDLFDIEIHGREAIDAVLAQGRGAFLMGAHLGSFEVLRAAGRHQAQLRVAMVMYADNARKINRALAAINPAAVQDVIPLGRVDSMLQVEAALDAGGVLGVLGDRSLESGATLALPFLEHGAEFPLGAMRLAAVLKRPVLFMAGLYLGGNRYAIHFEPLADFSALARADRERAVNRAVADYAACLERHCRAAPYNWFNFFDFWQSPAKRGAR